MDNRSARRQANLFLNNVGHGDQDPFTTTRQVALAGFGSHSDVEALRRAHKDLLIYSYEDDENFEEQRIRYVGESELRVIRRKWRRLLDPKVYRHTGHYLRRLMAKDGRNMKVLDRWYEMRGEAIYRSLFRDGEPLELSERLFTPAVSTSELPTGGMDSGTPRAPSELPAASV